MSFKNNLCKDADGLAPVVGTILMVGIVVILAAVIGTQALSVDTPDDHYERFKEITEQNINSQTLPDGLVARWSFEGNYEDVTGNANDGSAVGDVSFTDGISGQAIQLDGGYVEVPSSESLNITDEITLVAYSKWTIDPADGAGYANIVCKGGTSDNARSYRLQHRPSENDEFEFSVQFPSGNEWIHTSSGPQAGEWYQVVGVYNGTNMILYVNGENKDEESQSGSIMIYNTPLCIGSADGSRKFTGIIDEVQIYNRALSQAEIQSIGN
jgi:hypothetical protein